MFSLAVPPRTFVFCLAISSETCLRRSPSFEGHSRLLSHCALMEVSTAAFFADLPYVRT